MTEIEQKKEYDRLVDYLAKNFPKTQWMGVKLGFELVFLFTEN